MGIAPPSPTPPPAPRLPETETEKAFFKAIQENRFQNAVSMILRAPDGKKIPITQLNDEEGMTALHWTVQYSNSAGTRWLLDRQANLELQDNKGRTPLKIALDNKDERAMTILIEKGAKTATALPGHDAELGALTKTSDIIAFMLRTAAADAAKPPPPAAVAPTNNDGALTVGPAAFSFRRPITPSM